MILLLHHLGLALLGGVFLWAGIGHVLRFQAIAAAVAERGLPAPRLLLAAGSALEIGAGALVVSGIAVRSAAVALAAFTIAATVMMLDFWRYEGAERDALKNGFAVNVAVLGGLLVAAT